MVDFEAPRIITVPIKLYMFRFINIHIVKLPNTFQIITSALFYTRTQKITRRCTGAVTFSVTLV